MTYLDQPNDDETTSDSQLTEEQVENIREAKEVHEDWIEQRITDPEESVEASNAPNITNAPGDDDDE
jgi:hypothetical protein